MIPYPFLRSFSKKKDKKVTLSTALLLSQALQVVISSGSAHFMLMSTAQNTKFSIKNFFNKCYHIRSFLLIWSLWKTSFFVGWSHFISTPVNPIQTLEFSKFYLRKNRRSQLILETSIFFSFKHIFMCSTRITFLGVDRSISPINLFFPII